MDKILTIVIPTYNMEKYLEKCLSSLVLEDNGMMEKLEVLVINDGSKDRSSEIARSFQTRHPCTFRIIDKENGNYGSCINRGLKEAKGTYIKVLDADDSFNTEGLYLLLKTLTLEKVDLLLSDFVTLVEGKEQEKLHKMDLPANKVLKFEDYIDRYDILVFQMHAVTYRTDILRRLSYSQSEGVSYTDQEWIFAPLALVDKFIYMNSVVYKYLLGRAGQTVDNVFRKRKMGDEVVVNKKIISDYKTIQSLMSQKKSEYMKKKLMFRLTDFYFINLVTFNDPSSKSVNEMEEYLMNNEPYIYSELNDVVISRRLNYHFINEWRKNKKVSYIILLLYKTMHLIHGLK